MLRDTEITAQKLRKKRLEITEMSHGTVGGGALPERAGYALETCICIRKGEARQRNQLERIKGENRVVKSILLNPQLVGKAWVRHEH